VSAVQTRRMARVYRQYWRINVLTTLEYRENFLIWFAFTFVYHGSAIAGICEASCMSRNRNPQRQPSWSVK